MRRRVFAVIDADNQLANRLFVFAALIGCAEDLHATVVNLGFAEYADLFPATASDALCRYPMHRTPRLARPGVRLAMRRVAHRLVRVSQVAWLRGLSGRAIRIVTSGYVTTHNRPREERDRLECDLNEPALRAQIRATPVTVFAGPLIRDGSATWRHRDAIRSFFRPTNECAQRVDELIAALRASADLVIGVHVRQGDYAEFEDGRYLYSVEQYAQVMTRLVSLHSERRVGFVVCSNEDLSLDAFGALPVTFGLGRIDDDLHTLARCDLLVGPPSTFTAWASFMGDVPLAFVNDPDASHTRDDFRVVMQP